MLLHLHGLSVIHVFCLIEAEDAFSNEPDPCDTSLDPRSCICRFNGCVIACFMNNQISMQRGVKLLAFNSHTAHWFWM